MKIGIRKILYSAVTILFFAFTFQSIPPSGWYQQTLPNINGASIKDITFTDSLTGYIVTDFGGSNSYILKTTNGGDNWDIKFTNNRVFEKVKFINNNTGFTNAFTTIFKTTNAGDNWAPINLPGIFGNDMFVLNEDTIWLAMSESLTGGVFRTTNGGINWSQQLSIGNQNPNKIYMYNSRIGFIATSSGTPRIRRTTNGGSNWDVVVDGQNFNDIKFIDSLTGWRASGANMYKTTNGGTNWTTQILPNGSQFLWTLANEFKVLNKDTIWAVGGSITLSPGNDRGIIYKTTNGGNTWGYQLPDTSINIFQYRFIDFVNSKTGWAYGTFQGGVHTKIGGDTLTSVKQINSEIPTSFELKQNYPNPFNPVTKILFSVKGQRSNVKLKIFDIFGKEISLLVNESLNTGIYEIVFNGNNLSSGTYFYSLYIDNHLVDTKKMMLLK